MIILTIKIKGESASFTKKEFMPDSYQVCKDNENLQRLVEKTVKEANIEAIDSVVVNARFEW